MKGVYPQGHALVGFILSPVLPFYLYLFFSHHEVSSITALHAPHHDFSVSAQPRNIINK
jgi:hypothetical protein